MAETEDEAVRYTLSTKKNVNTLLAYRHSRLLKAEDGEKGDKCMRFGHQAPDVVSEVPVGTVVYEEDGKTLIADLKHEDDTVCVAKGGRGGRGNAAFKSSRIRILELPKMDSQELPSELSWNLSFWPMPA